MNSLTIVSGASLVVSESNTGLSNPAIFAVRTAVQIEGTLSVAGNGSGPGPGGYPITTLNQVGVLLTGPGGGGSGGVPGSFRYSSPSGGGFCGTGGEGALLMPGTPTPRGGPYGSATLLPLQAGSSGGVWSDTVATPGGAGGGLQISAGGGIFVSSTGVVNAGGGGGAGGGGSGGSLLLEGPTIVVEGVLAANGGGGGRAT
jgi:hypothetical protein